MTRAVAQELICKDSRLIEAYLDGELDAAGLVEIETHLNGGGEGARGCDVCHERIALTRATRQSLKRVVRTAALESASGGRDALRARALTAMMAEQERQAATNVRQLHADDGRFHWRTLVPIASAAALALFWGAASRGPITALGRQEPRWPDSRTAASMNAGMGDDLLADLLHEHSNPMPPQWTDPSDVRALDRYIGVPVLPARFERTGALLVGARVLPVHQERAAMLQYVIGHGASQRRLSVFVYDPRKIRIVGPGLSPRAVGTSQVQVGQENGYSVAVTQNGGVGYAVASDLGTDQSAEVAALANDGE